MLKGKPTIRVANIWFETKFICNIYIIIMMCCCVSRSNSYIREKEEEKKVLHLRKMILKNAHQYIICGRNPCHTEGQCEWKERIIFFPFFLGSQKNSFRFSQVKPDNIPAKEFVR